MSRPAGEPEALYNFADAARYLDRPRRYIERHVEAGHLNPGQLVGGRRYLTRSELDAFAAKQPGHVRHPHPTVARGWCRPSGPRRNQEDNA